MRKENKRGITLISLVITILVLLILTTVSTYSGIKAITNSKFTNFTTMMKVMQLEINSLYEKYKNGDTISVNGTNYSGEQISRIESNVTSEVSAKKDKIFDELGADSEAGIYEDEKEKYKFWDNKLIKDLGIDGVEGSFFVNIEKRNFISYDGIKYNGKTYYTLQQLPDSLYNVEYENPNTEKPSFDVKIEYSGQGKWKISVSNIQYNRYINKWQVKYKLDKQEFWKTSYTLDFIVNEEGVYSVKIVNGDVESDSKQVDLHIEVSNDIDRLKVEKKLLENNTSIMSVDNVKVTIPAGFTIPEESPNNAKEGIIITDSIDESTGKSNGNEFVWIPVDPDLKVVGTEKVMAKESTAEDYKGTDAKGRTNYEGVLYNFTGTDSTEMTPSDYGQKTEYGYREPDSKIVYDYEKPDGQTPNYIKDLQQWLPNEVERYKDNKTFMNTMQEDYNEMIDSVKKYGGFYVGRYEMGVEDVIEDDNVFENKMATGKATSKIGQVRNSLDWFVSRQWYGLYSKAKKYTNEKKSVKSSMIWGSQYDAMLNYALTGDDKEKVTKAGNGYYGDKEVDTGVTPNDKILNIFDLEGNHIEWTLEANSNNFRVARGSYYNNTEKFLPSSRYNLTCDSTAQYIATRFTLYIQEIKEN